MRPLRAPEYFQPLALGVAGKHSLLIPLGPGGTDIGEGGADKTLSTATPVSYCDGSLFLPHFSMDDSLTTAQPNQSPAAAAELRLSLITRPGEVQPSLHDIIAPEYA